MSIDEASRIMDSAKTLLEKYPLCDHCLGRQFAKYGLQLKNSERGYSIKVLLQMLLHREAEKIDKDELRRIAENSGRPISLLYEKLYGEKINTRKCYICGGKLSYQYYEELAKRVAELLNQYNAYTFLIGVTINQELALKEIEVSIITGLESSESIKNEIKREVGKIVKEKHGFEPDFNYPDVVVIIDFDTDGLKPIVNPVLLEGKYWKRGRNISHTIWINRRGQRTYPYSIEEFMNDRLRELFEAERIILHASGREDVDARMLGTGRPMVIEVKNPRFRYVDLDLINEVLRSDLVEAVVTGRSTRSKIEYLKGEGSKKNKAYKVLVYVEKKLDENELLELEKYFENRVVHQRTPTRILRRKKDYLRIKRVHEVKTRIISENVFEALIYCEGGLYVKELVHGDAGRTTPSFSEFLAAKAYPLELDVIAVETLER